MVSSQLQLGHVFGYNWDVGATQTKGAKTQMSTVEERIERLEMAVFGKKAEPGRDDWQKTVGMFRGNETMKQILDDVRDAREKEREESRKLDNTEK